MECLTKIYLFFDTAQGILPEINFQGVYLAKLRDLGLRNHIFYADEQFDWIFKHKTLEVVSLSDSSIAPITCTRMKLNDHGLSIALIARNVTS